MRRRRWPHMAYEVARDRIEEPARQGARGMLVTALTKRLKEQYEARACQYCQRPAMMLLRAARGRSPGARSGVLGRRFVDPVDPDM